MPNREIHYPTDALFKGLRILLASLPTELEKRELLQTLKETQDFLDELQSLVEAIPTMESSGDLSAGLSRLDILGDRARENTALRRLLGLRGSTGTRSNSRTTHENTAVRANELEQELTQLENSAVITRLENSKEPLAVLREVAKHLGMRTRGKERKLDLAKRIAIHVVNQRGYRKLRGENLATQGTPPTLYGATED